MPSQPKHVYLNIIRQLLTTAALIAAATVIGWLFRLIDFPETNIVIVYLLSILITARLTDGYLYGIAASIFATGTFNYFFTRPYYTLTVNDPDYLITFAMMTGTAVITSTLTSKAKKNADEAKEKEAEASALFKLTNRLTDAADIADIAGIAVETISEMMNCHAACLCFDENGQPEHSYIQQISKQKQIRRELENGDDIRRRINNLRTAYDAGQEFYDWPVCGRDAILGVIRIPSQSAAAMSEPQNRLIRSIIENAALAMDRFRSMKEQQISREETIQEKYRSNLLRAISHDLRTPLAGIMGTAEMLKDMTRADDPRHALANDIYMESDWLHSLVQNILSLTRLQDGALPLSRQMVPVEEVIGGAVTHVIRLSGREIAVDVPDEVLFIPMDAGLIEQVLVNLLDNAVKHTASVEEIRVSLRRDDEKHMAVITVSNRGSGIREDDLPNIFQMFYTSTSRKADATRGVGLGLTICKAIVEAHGGLIQAGNRRDGPGVEFVFSLPMEDPHDTTAK